MTGKEFLHSVSDSKDDFPQAFLDLLRNEQIPFCAIGGLAVNASVEPVVSLDLNLVPAADRAAALLPSLQRRWKVETFPHSINLSSPSSALRIHPSRFIPPWKNSRSTMNDSASTFPSERGTSLSS